jgi:hypothetical protein
MRPPYSPMVSNGSITLGLLGRRCSRGGSPPDLTSSWNWKACCELTAGADVGVGGAAVAVGGAVVAVAAAGADVAVAACSGGAVGAAVLAQATAATPAAARDERRKKSLRVTFFITFLLRNEATEGTNSDVNQVSAGRSPFLDRNAVVFGCCGLHRWGSSRSPGGWRNRVGICYGTRMPDTAERPYHSTFRTSCQTRTDAGRVTVGQGAG